MKQEKSKGSNSTYSKARRFTSEFAPMQSSKTLVTTLQERSERSKKVVNKEVKVNQKRRKRSISTRW